MKEECSQIRVVIAGGGTGGHLFPAIAVADQLRSIDSTCKILFIGSQQGLESQVVPKAGYDLELLLVGKLKGTKLSASLKTFAGLPFAVISAFKLLLHFKADVVVGVGGYASGPVALAAFLLNKPILLLEQNTIPGMTNRILSHISTRIAVSFKSTVDFFPKECAIRLGNPVRQAVISARRNVCTDKKNSKHLLILGGSQGAHRINELVVSVSKELFEKLPMLSIMHQTGKQDFEWVQNHYETHKMSAKAEPFVDDMAGAYAKADLVLSRSGATTVAELGVVGVPALFIPFPFAADDHQFYNAKEMVEAKAAVMVRQEETNSEMLLALLIELLGDDQRLKKMGKAMLTCGRPDAALDIAKLIIDLASSRDEHV